MNSLLLTYFIKYKVYKVPFYKRFIKLFIRPINCDSFKKKKKNIGFFFYQDIFHVNLNLLSMDLQHQIKKNAN